MAQSLPEEPHFKYYETKSPEKKTLTNKEKLIAAMSGLVLLLVVGGGLAINKYSHKNQPVETEVPTAPVETPQITIETTPAVAEKPEVATETIPTVESLEMNSSLMKNSEELAKTFEDKLSTEWLNAGATRENADAASNIQDLLGYSKKIASEYDQAYIDALFVKEWESVPSLVEKVKRMKNEHTLVLYAYFSTSFQNIFPEDTEPYTRGIKVTNIDSSNISTDKKTISIVTTEHNYDNASKNRISSEPYEAFHITGQDNHPTLTFKVEGDKLKLSNIIFN